MKILNLFNSKKVANSDVAPVKVDTTNDEQESAKQRIVLKKRKRTTS